MKRFLAVVMALALGTVTITAQAKEHRGRGNHGNGGWTERHLFRLIDSIEPLQCLAPFLVNLDSVVRVCVCGKEKKKGKKDKKKKKNDK